MFNNLIQSIIFIGHWGYLVIFVIVVLECQALLGLFVPGESLVLTGGFLAKQGIFDPIILIVVIAAAAVLGDSIGFNLGRYLGMGWLTKHGRRFRLCQEHLNRMDGFFTRHGGMAVFVSHFMHLMRALMPFIAGTSPMRYRRFFIFNTVGCIVWATIFVMIGYFVGASWRVVEQRIDCSNQIVVATVLFAIALVCLWRRFVRHKSVTTLH